MKRIKYSGAVTENLFVIKVGNIRFTIDKVTKEFNTLDGVMDAIDKLVGKRK